jgi:S-adenosylmethionine hydrolase
VSRIVTLLSDFGSQDGYVGAMKGVILQINPRVLPVDISHEIEAHDIMAGALVLASAYAYFPPGTIHVAVVDPGVGGRRRPIIVETSQACFVGPDNGIFTLIYEREDVIKTVAIENPGFMAPSVSPTFHGRDIFAPAAAHLSLGVPVDDFGPSVERGAVLNVPQPRLAGETAEGEVIHVDRFGNLITNISGDLFTQFVGKGLQTIRLGSQEVAGPYESYEEACKGELFAVFGGTGLLEISRKSASAHEPRGPGRGTIVRVTRSPRGETKP